MPGTPGPKGDPGIGLPAGGTTGQVLTKTGAADYVAAWRTPEGGSSGGSSSGSGIKRMLLDDMSISRIGMDETTGLYGLYFPAAVFGASSAAEIVQSYLYHDLTVLSDELPSSPIMYYSLEAVTDATILFQPAQIPADMVQKFDGEDYIPVILDGRGEEFMATLQALINGLIITYSDNIETVAPAASVQTMGGLKAGVQSMSTQTQPEIPAFLRRIAERAGRTPEGAEWL